jgi:hypothetical protein
MSLECLDGFDRLINEQLNRNCDASSYDLDCFVTSEVSYNHVVACCLPSEAIPNGAYLGVGPDQNYIYIGAFRPDFAIILDARIDNLLEHLLFKLTFETAETPLHFLALLFGRRIPAWVARDIADGRTLLSRLAHCPALDEEFEENFRSLLARVNERWSMPAPLLARFERICREFYRRQTQITSVSGPTLAQLDQMPNFEDVVSSTTPEGFNFHFLTDAGRFAHVKRLHALDRIVPLLGNLTSAPDIDASKQLIARAGCTLRSVYISNMEEFLIQRYVIAGGRVTERPNAAGLLTDKWGRHHKQLFDNLARLEAPDDCILIRYFFPASYRGRSLGVFPWLQPHVAFMGRLLRAYRQLPPESVMETYY